MGRHRAPKLRRNRVPHVGSWLMSGWSSRVDDTTPLPAVQSASLRMLAPTYGGQVAGFATPGDRTWKRMSAVQPTQRTGEKL